jgi:hypothetical protein
LQFTREAQFIRLYDVSLTLIHRFRGPPSPARGKAEDVVVLNKKSDCKCVSIIIRREDAFRNAK